MVGRRYARAAPGNTRKIASKQALIRLLSSRLIFVASPDGISLGRHQDFSRRLFSLGISLKPTAQHRMAKQPRIGLWVEVPEQERKKVPRRCGHLGFCWRRMTRPAGNFGEDAESVPAIPRRLMPPHDIYKRYFRTASPVNWKIHALVYQETDNPKRTRQ